MRTLVLTFFISMSCCVFAKKQQAQITVVDALNGELLQGASVTLWINPPRTKFWESRRTVQQPLIESDTHVFEAEYQVGEDCGASCSIKKKGYYWTSFSLPQLISQAPHQMTIKLYPKINPISLIQKTYHYRDEVILSYNGGGDSKRAFDCLKADWLPPHGGGEHADILFTLEQCKIKSKQYACLTVHFVNPNDGLMLIKEGYAPPALFIREAPQDLHLTQTLSFLKPLNQRGYIEDFPKTQYYVFRVRTSLTPAGEIESAYYGKLSNAFDWYYGGQEPDKLGLMFNYFLNPTPNERNLEYNGCPINKLDGEEEL